MPEDAGDPMRGGCKDAKYSIGPKYSSSISFFDNLFKTA